MGICCSKGGEETEKRTQVYSGVLTSSEVHDIDKLHQEDKHMHEDIPPDQHPSANVPPDQHPHEDIPPDQHPSANVPPDQHPHEDIPPDQHPSANVTPDQRTHADVPPDQHPQADVPPDQRTHTNVPPNQHPHADVPRDQCIHSDVPSNQHTHAPDQCTHSDVPPSQRTHLYAPPDQHPHRGSHCPDPSRLPPSTPSVRELGSLKLTGSYKWYHLGLQLGIEGYVLDQIEENYPRDSQMRKNKMFGAWLKRDPEASWDKVAVALLKLGENALANFIASNYGSTHGKQNIPRLPSHAHAHSVSTCVSVTQCNSSESNKMPQCIAAYAKDLKIQFKRMNVLPDEDWPPSVGRHKSNLALIQHEQDMLPTAKEAEQMQKDYVGGNVNRILKRKKEITYEAIFDFSINRPKDASFSAHGTSSKSSTDEQSLEEETINEENRHFRMLIDGAPGVGKTVLCRQFAKDWGTGKILQQFSVVKLLHLREERVAKAKSIEDLFQHYNKKLQRQVVEHIEETGGEGSLLICDGFDELSEKERTQNSLFLDIIHGKVLPNCSVIVTSRPYASLYLQQLCSISRHVEVVGFTDQQIKECIKRNITDKVKADELVEQLTQRLDIFSLCYIPLNCAIVLYVYKQQNYKLPRTLTQLYTLYILHALKRSARIHFSETVQSASIRNLNTLPECMKVPFSTLCEMAFNGLQDDQLGFSQLPQILQECPGGRGTKPELLGLMSGAVSFPETGEELSYQFTHLTVQEFLAAWFAANKLSAEEQSKLFQEKWIKQRFKMMLLFLAGITELQDKEVYLQILHSFELQHHHPRHVLEAQSELEEESQRKQIIFFLAHLIYEAQNSSLSHHLARSVQKCGELSLTFNDLFHCTVLMYFLSTSNFSWKLLELESETDQTMGIIQQAFCEHSGKSHVKDLGVREQLTPNKAPPLTNTQELRLVYLGHPITSPPEPTSLSCLVNIPQLTKLTVSPFHIDQQCIPAWNESLIFLFRALTDNTTLHDLVIASYHEIDEEAVEALQYVLKMNTSFQRLVLCRLGLTDSTAEDIANMLVENHSLKTLNISMNNITAVGAVKIFRALERNNTLETLNMGGNRIYEQNIFSSITPVSPSRSLLSLVAPPNALLHSALSLSKSGKALSKLSLPACLPSFSTGSTLSTNSLSTRSLSAPSLFPSFEPLHSSPIPILPTLDDDDVVAALCDMEVHNFYHAQWDSKLFIQWCAFRVNAEKHEALGDMLSHNHTLTELDIWWSSHNPNEEARGLLRNTTLKEFTFLNNNDRQCLMDALVELRRQEGHTQQPDPVISRYEQVLKYE